MAQTTQEMWQAIIDQLSAEKVRVIPYRGTNRSIEQLPYVDGAIYFAYDTGAIFMDKAVVEEGETIIKRFSMGGAGSATNLGFVYTHADMNENTLVKCNPDVDNFDDPDYFIYRAAFDDNILSFPSVDTLIINSNGWFFRVKEIQGTEDRIVAAIISAGTAGGGGAGGGAAEDDLFLEQGTGWGSGHTYIYGQTMPLQMTATATRSDDVEVSIYAYDEQHKSVIVNEIKKEKSGQPFYFDTSILPESNDITIRISLGTTPEGKGLNATSRMLNAYKPTFTYSNIKVVEMGIAKSPNTVTSSYYTGPMNLGFIVVGNSSDVTVTPHLYIDGIERPAGLNPFPLSGANKTISIAKQEHGIHNIELYLTTNLNGVDLRTDSIFYELAWVDPNSDIPLIWFESLPNRVVNYDNVIIKYQVYNPVTEKINTTTQVNLLQEREPIPNSPVSISYDQTKWLEWDISSLYKIKGIEDTENNFSISCGAVRRDFSFIVTSVGARDLGLVNENSLVINLSSAGRSNNEDASVRDNWSYTNVNTDHTYRTTFTAFNWFNNGWMDDASGNGAYLSVANGASATIDFAPIELNSTSSTTIEMRFRVRNIQEYSTLVTTVARYNVEEDPDKAYTLDEIAANGYTMKYDPDGNPLMNEAQSTKETISEKGVCFKYFDSAGYGFCIGTQEAFFKSRAGVANVRYKEDEVINLSFAIAGGDNQHILYIYLNGILSGAINLTRNSGIESIGAAQFEINSKYCDFDLYKLRVYSTYLSMPEIIHNYLSDMRNIDLYDQNQLTDPRDPTNLMYTKVVEYNDSIKKEYAAATSRTDVQAYINKLTMPYAVIQLIDNISELNLKTPEGGDPEGPDDDRLPYIKDGGNRYAKITFVNPALDEALDKGIITEDFYYTHSPSYEAVGVDINVQGTSSQGYPRRNYKTKFKSATKDAPSGYNPMEDENYVWGWRYTHGSKAGKKLKKWNMDNEDCKTSKFTWKIDYMESSGSYNTGFANLVGNNIYSKHPLEYYNLGIDVTNYRTSVYGFPVMVFHKHSQQEDLEKYNTKNEADVYTYIGRYNLNLDKSANEFYGFEVEDEHPYANLETPIDTTNEDGTITTRTKKTIAETAECWELRDNQGTWTSFKYPDDARESKFGTTDSSGALEVIKHFEYRYNPDEDALDICYEKGEDATNNAVEWYNGIVDLSTQLKKNEFLRKKYSNLEKFFTWLDSTDTTKVPQTDTGIALSETEKARKFDETIKYMIASVEEDEEADGTTKKVTNTYIVDAAGNHIYKMPTARDEQGNLILNKDENGYLLDDDNQSLNAYIAADNYAGTTRSFDIKVSYQTDCAGYRIHKFKDEFSEHLNLEYCVIYFILTELLLCYDSRGKNMMLASWGPQREGGDYIWFPIFYDVDTQLGLNNIGAVLWDYNADATLDGNFSTANSVLWVNLWAAFRTTIEAKYRELRAGRLTETNIEGAYLCDPNVFTNSYAMKGVRPVIALGLDEYYKYILPGDDSGAPYQSEPWKAVRYSGFLNSDGGTWSTNTGYLYTCQGDRKLSRELLIRNRLNYLDSWWLAGSYVAEAVKQGIMIRANANDTHTSDKYLDSSLISETVAGYENVPYPKKYFDATPNFEITPFLSQYVTVFYDEDPIVPSIKYNGINAVKTNTTPSVENGYRAIHPYNEQLTYIPGGDYVSSLGDLSLKYPSHFTLGTGMRLLDVTLGSDIPGYNNGLLGKGEGTFDLNAGQTSANKKGLLQKIILTGVSGLSSTLDISTTEKLQEFRALGTNITGVTFASGSPLDTVHLPNSVTGLTLTEAKDLTHILTNKPVVMEEILGEDGQPTGEYKYLDKVNYEGLYIEGITDYKDTDTDELNFLTLELFKDNLGYDSYHLMDNMIKKRIRTYEIDNSKNKPIALTLTGVKWSPYTRIESNEEPNADKEYYQVTDHGTFISYRYTDDYENFIRLRRNEKLFTYDAILLEKEADTITSLQYLDLFIEDHAEHTGNSIIYRADNSTNYRIPNIQGVIYVNNDSTNPIKETDLDKKTGKYALNFPNLTIYAKYVDESYVAKFIQEDDLGKENEFELRRVDKNSDDLLAPYPSEIPVKQNYDFVGWSLTPDGSDIVITYDETNGLQTTDDFAQKCAFAIDKDTIVFYATFVLHKYIMRFYNDDNALLETTKETFKTTPGISNPTIVPSSSLINSLDLFETYRWIGWAKKTNPSVVVDLATEVTPIMDIDFIAVYELTSVYDNVLDPEYLIYEEVAGGYSIALNNAYSLSGKITLPTQINDRPVVQAGTRTAGFGNDTVVNTITHIFWADPPTEGSASATRALTTINGRAFANMPSLVYYEQPDTCRSIGTNAFEASPQLGSEDATVIKDILDPVAEVGNGLFMDIGRTIIYIPGHDYTVFADRPFGGLQHTSEIIIGGPGDPCLWGNMANNQLNTNSQVFNGFADLLGGSKYGKITIYTVDGMPPKELITSIVDDQNIYGYFGIDAATTITIVQA